VAEAELARFVDRYTFEFVRTFPHPIERVWRAIVDDAEISAWFDRCTIDARLGGAFHFGGEESRMKGTTQLIELWSKHPEWPALDIVHSRKAAFKKWDRSKLIEEFHAAGLGAEAIVAPHERFDHPQLRETGAVVEVIDPEVGPTTQLGVTIFLEGTPGEVQGPQPLAGAHTDEVLRSLGHADEEIAGLRERGVI